MEYCNGTLYYVINENTLGYQNQARQQDNQGKQIEWIDVLAGSVLRGGRNWKDGPFPLSTLDKVRPATKADFDSYRVCSKGHLK